MSGPKPVVRPSRNMDDHPACCVICRHVIRDGEPRERVRRPVIGPAHEWCVPKEET